MGNVGIYKITSPSNKVYIGQSWDICKRKSNYKSLRCGGQRHLHSSINKYGFNDHVFEVVHELPKDVTQEIMDTYECLYMDLYKSCCISLLNIREGGSKGKLAKETIAKLVYINTGKKASDETKKKMSLAGKGRKMTIEAIVKMAQTKKERGITMSKDVIEKGIPTRFKKGIIVWNKGKTNVYSEEMLARIRSRRSSDETKEKIRIARAKQIMQKGRKPSQETRIKMSESAKKRGNNLPFGFTHSAETRKKISDFHKGKPSHNKGKFTSETTKAKQRQARLGKPPAKPKRLVCALSGIIYPSIKEAAVALSIKRTTLNSYLTGQTKNNKTTLKYLHNG